MTSQKVIWAEIAKLDTAVVNIALDELMRSAIDGGASSHACEVIALIMTPLSSINVRGQIISKMRKAGRSFLILDLYLQDYVGARQGFCEANRYTRGKPTLERNCVIVTLGPGRVPTIKAS
jgi:hypothetical protein